MTLSIEFWEWDEIPSDRKHEHPDGSRVVFGETFLGEPVWLPWMHV